MSDRYEQLKQNNLSQEGREKLDDGGYYEVTVFVDWTNPPSSDPDNYLTIDFVLNDEIEEEFFPEINFESDDTERDNQIADVLNHSLSTMLERGLILDAYGNEHIDTVDKLEKHVTDFRIIS